MKILNNMDSFKYISIDNVGNADIKNIFYDLKRTYNCTYMTYMSEMEGRTVFFSTNDSWSSFFIEEGLINICPIYNNAFSALDRRGGCVFSAWEHVVHKPGVETDLKYLRASYGLGNGFGMAMKQDGGSEALCFGSTLGNSNFHYEMSDITYVVCSYIKLLQTSETA